MAHTGPYPLLSITTTTLITKCQPWRPERSTYVGPSSPIAWPSPASAGPRDTHPSVLPSAAPAGYPSYPQPRIETQCLTPQITGPASSEANPLEPAYTDGHMSPTPPNPTSGPKTTTTLNLTFDAPPKRGPLLSSGAVRVRLAWATRRDTNRRRTNARKKTIHARGSLADTLPSLTPNPRKDRDPAPLLPGSLHTFGWRLDPNYKIRHNPPPRAE